MMPMRPAARANWLVGLLPRLDLHVGHKALVLPAGEVFAHDLLDLSLAGKIVIGDGGEKRLLPALAERSPS